MNNEYRVFALDPVSMTRYDNELLHASEVGSTFCKRQCCGPMRDNRTEIFMKSTNTTVGVYEKGCGISWCCCCKASAVFTSLLGGSENRYDAVSPNGCPGFTTLGFKLQNFWFRGPRSCCGHMPCFTYAFDITDDRNGMKEGAVIKMQQTCAELVYKTNKFNVVFPKGASSEDKLAIIAATLHSDYNFFEQKKK